MEYLGEEEGKSNFEKHNEDSLLNWGKDILIVIKCLYLMYAMVSGSFLYYRYNAKIGFVNILFAGFFLTMASVCWYDFMDKYQTQAYFMICCSSLLFFGTHEHLRLKPNLVMRGVFLFLYIAALFIPAWSLFTLECTSHPYSYSFAVIMSINVAFSMYVLFSYRNGDLFEKERKTREEKTTKIRAKWFTVVSIFLACFQIMMMSLGYTLVQGGGYLECEQQYPFIWTYENFLGNLFVTGHVVPLIFHCVIFDIGFLLMPKKKKAMGLVGPLFRSNRESIEDSESGNARLLLRS